MYALGDVVDTHAMYAMRAEQLHARTAIAYAHDAEAVARTRSSWTYSFVHCSTASRHARSDNSCMVR